MIRLDPFNPEEREIAVREFHRKNDWEGAINFLAPLREKNTARTVTSHTLDTMLRNGVIPSMVRFVQHRSGDLGCYQGTWEDFKKLADRIPRSGSFVNGIKGMLHPGLQIVGANWWMVLYNREHIQRWEFHRIPEPHKNPLPLTHISIIPPEK